MYVIYLVHITHLLTYLVRWVPDWFPCAAWKQKAVQWRAETEAMIEVPYQRAKAAAVSFDIIKQIH